jgi:lauroyl/myristoyl acyltransferase
MMDFCYPGSADLQADFFGRSVSTPAGVLTLAERFDCPIAFLSLRDGCLQPIDEFSAKESGAGGAAERINRTIESEILRDEPRWLLWTTMKSRWLTSEERDRHRG